MLSAASPALARAGLLAAINAARSAGCEGRPQAAPLHSNAALDQVARHLSRGERLRDSLAAVGYRAMHSASLFISHAGDDTTVARTVAQRSCPAAGAEPIRDIGLARRGEDLWIVLAAPFAAPAVADATAASRRVVDLANAARSRPRRCGDRQFAAVPPLTVVAALGNAARAHSLDMAAHSDLSHAGSDGSTPGGRAAHAGYRWRVVGENVASGPTSPEEAVAGWLASPGHCENLMDPRFTATGVALAVDPKSAAGVYWTQVFAAPSANR